MTFGSTNTTAMKNKHLSHFQKYLFKYFFILTLLLSFLNSKASGMIGAEISYQCLGNGNYQITMKVYRDCQGIGMCTCPGMAGCSLNGISISSANSSVCNFTPLSVAMNIDPSPTVSGYDVVQLCRSVKTTCSNCGTRTPGTMTPAIEVYTFRGTVNLNSIPSNCCNVVASWSDCCLNAAITNLNNPSGQSIYVSTPINRCLSTCNSSPVLTNTPPVLVCAGQVFNYNLGAIDPDGDSLSYNLGVPLVAANSPAAFKPPYSSNYQFPYMGNNPNLPAPLGLSVNHVTGDICFTPSGNFVVFFVIEITEWKRDIYGQSFEIGKTSRDLIFYSVSTCDANNPPKIVTYNDKGQLVNNAGTLGTMPASYAPRNNWSVCANKELCFFVEATDDVLFTDTTDLSISALGSIADASKGRYSITPVYSKQTYDNSDEHIGQIKFDKLKFCWTPNSAAYRPSRSPYYISVIAKDRLCPIPGRSIISFAITVNQTPDAVISLDAFKCNNYRFKYTLTPQTANTIINHNYTRWYVETEPGSGVYTSKSPDVSNPYLMNTTFAKGGKYNIYLRLASIAPPTPDGCPNDSIPFTINIPEFVKAIAPNAFNCFGKPVKVTAGGIWGTPGNNSFEYFNMLNGNLVSISPNSKDSAFFITPKTNSIYKVVITESSQGCTDTASFNFNRYQSAQNRDTAIHISLVGSNAQCVNANSFTFSNGSNLSNVYGYYWKSEDGSISNDMPSGITKTYNNPGMHNLSLLALKDTLNCLVDSNYFSITINPLPNTLTSKTGNIYKCQNDSVLVSPLTLSNTNNYIWYYKNPNQVLQAYPLNQSSIFMNAVGAYYLLVQDQTTQCKDSSAEINFIGTLKVPATFSFSKTVILCNYEPIVLTAPNNTSYRWLKDGIEVSKAQSYTINQDGLYSLITGSGVCADTNYWAPQWSVVKVSNNGNRSSYSYCANSNGALVTIKPNAEALSYDWMLGNQIIKSGLENSIQINAGNNILKVVATNILGCKDSLNIALSTLEMKTTQLSIIGDTNACTGNITNISNPVLMDATYYFQKDGLHYDSVFNYINVTQSGNYRLILKTLSSGCRDTSRTIPIMLNTFPILSKFVMDTITFCDGSIVDLNANGTGSDFVWKLNGKQIPKSRKSNIKITVPGFYTVINSNGVCSDSASVVLTSIAKPTKPIITAIADTLFASSNGNRYVWFFNGQAIPNVNDSKFISQNSGTFRVIVNNSLGCTDTSNEYIFIKSGLLELTSDAIKLFPNPTSNSAKLDLNAIAVWQIYISDMSGKTIRSYKAFKGKEITIQKEDIKAGEYLLQIKNLDTNKSSSTKLIFD